MTLIHDIMRHFLEHLESIFEFELRETTPEKMLDILNERIRQMTDAYVTLRDAENFIAYFRCLLSISHIPKSVEFRRDLVRAFIERTNTSLSSNALDYRMERLYAYLEDELGEGIEITKGRLDEIGQHLSQIKKPTFRKVMERIQVATILKWLQGPLNDRLSHELQDHIVFLATVYGQCKKNALINVEWQSYQMPADNANLLVSEYRLFEIALIEALQAVRNIRAANPDLQSYEKQFQIVFSSFDNLVKLEEAGKLDSFDSFKDRLIISTALIYIQDDFVQKDRELKKLIQLFVSLYFKYRDKRHESEVNVKSNS